MNTTYQSQSKTEIVQLQPEYRTEYINRVDVNSEV